MSVQIFTAPCLKARVRIMEMGKTRGDSQGQQGVFCQQYNPDRLPGALTTEPAAVMLGPHKRNNKSTQNCWHKGPHKRASARGCHPGCLS
eukprot:1160835-Pelagomonas_calceolata.AAC.3